MTNQTVSYKGRSYRLLWQGGTKYGERAHLAFMDGSKDFWVDAALVSGASASRSHASARRSRGEWLANGHSRSRPSLNGCTNPRCDDPTCCGDC